MRSPLLFSFTTLFVFCMSAAGHTVRSLDCESLLLEKKSLAHYVENSKELPTSFNILALRDFQRSQELHNFLRLNARIRKSYSSFYTADKNERLNSSIKQVLGQGWMSEIVQLKDDRVIKLIAPNVTSKIRAAVSFETEAWATYHLQKNSDRYHIKTLPILFVGPNGIYLEKPYVSPTSIGSEILKSEQGLSEAQINKLKDLHRNSIRLAEETGISLDIKADNMFWDGEDWIVFDPIGSISHLDYARTLDVRDFDQYFLRWPGNAGLKDTGLKIDDVVNMYPNIRAQYKKPSLLFRLKSLVTE